MSKRRAKTIRNSIERRVKVNVLPPSLQNIILHAYLVGARLRAHPASTRSEPAFYHLFADGDDTRCLPDALSWLLESSRSVAPDRSSGEVTPR